MELQRKIILLKNRGFVQNQIPLHRIKQGEDEGLIAL